MKKFALQLPDDFLESSGIFDTRQREIALAIREVLAKNFGLPTDKVHSLAEPNQMMFKLATKGWDDLDFLTDIQEKLGFNHFQTIYDHNQLDSLFTFKFFGFTIRQGAKTIGEWVNATSLLCLKNQ
ncbi:MAG: hypothetical protein LBL62_09340 [Planctomycetaceae bacterium]|jgi:hypothetical protein|nr:hypothetical protein [Planctomycetaceae bacterium]